MKNFDATRSNDAPLHCYYCGRAIADGNWFARVRLGDGRVALCRPVCVERLLDHPDQCEGGRGRSLSAELPAQWQNLNPLPDRARERAFAVSSEAFAA
jgi:hypothetical protein